MNAATLFAKKHPEGRRDKTNFCYHEQENSDKYTIDTTVSTGFVSVQQDANELAGFGSFFLLFKLLVQLLF